MARVVVLIGLVCWAGCVGRRTVTRPPSCVHAPAESWPGVPEDAERIGPLPAGLASLDRAIHDELLGLEGWLQFHHPATAVRIRRLFWRAREWGPDSGLGCLGWLVTNGAMLRVLADLPQPDLPADVERLMAWLVARAGRGIELRMRNGMLVVRAGPAGHVRMRALLDAVRARRSFDDPGPARGGATEPRTSRVYNVRDLVFDMREPKYLWAAERHRAQFEPSLEAAMGELRGLIDADARARARLARLVDLVRRRDRALAAAWRVAARN